MLRKMYAPVMAILLVLIIGLPVLTYAGNLPETPITKILNYKSGLVLTDSQVKNLELINNNIINKMLQFRSQAQICKTRIDEYSKNWTDLTNPQVKGAVKEYYHCQAELKALEFEAMAQAGKILSPEQITKFNDLASIELMMINDKADALKLN